LRGSFDKFHDRASTQVLSAFANDTSLVLAHVEIAETSNKIPAAQALLAELSIRRHHYGRCAPLPKKHFEIARETQFALIAQVEENQRTLHRGANRPPGEIAGTYLDPAVGYRVFTLSNGAFATVDPAGSVNGSSLVSLNNAGQVVGFSNTATPPEFGNYDLATGGVYSAFPPSGVTVPASAGYSFYNDKGAIAGQTSTQAFIAQGSTLTKITPPNGGNVTINTINNANQAVGGYFPATPPPPARPRTRRRSSSAAVSSRRSIIQAPPSRRQTGSTTMARWSAIIISHPSPGRTASR
jgi:hypothetical protein